MKMSHDEFAVSELIKYIGTSKQVHAFPYYNESHQFDISKLSLEHVTIIIMIVSCTKLLPEGKTYIVLRHTWLFISSCAPQTPCRNLRESRVPEIPTPKYRKFSTSSLSKEWSLVGIIVIFINFFYILFLFHYFLLSF